MVDSTPSYYSTLDSCTEGDSVENGDWGSTEHDEDDNREDAHVKAASVEGRRRFQRQQRLLRLLRSLATELSAVDARGLTPLHYAIANQNASMVYLLCAYGATFIFASKQTEEHLVGHPVVEVVAAAALGGGAGAGSGGAGSSSMASGSDRDSLRHAATTSTVVVSPTTPSTTGTFMAARGEKGASAWPHVNAPQALSATVPAPVFATTIGGDGRGGIGLGATAAAAAAAPSIRAATDVLAYFSEYYHAQLTPAAQAALHKTAKAGSAEYLLLHLPTREKREAEQWTDLPPRLLHATLPPMTPATAATSSPTSPSQMTAAMAPGSIGMLQSPPPSCGSFVSSQQQQLQQHTTMAATLIEALGLGRDGSFTAAAPAATSVPNALGEMGQDARDTASPGEAVLSLTATDPVALPAATTATGEAVRKEDEAPQQRRMVGTAAPATTGRATSTREATESVVCDLLEPHDVFLTHVVRNPAKADSIVRAAMEGTALRYLFQASLALSSTERCESGE